MTVFMNEWFAEYDLAIWIYGLPKMNLAKVRSKDCDGFMKACWHNDESKVVCTRIMY